MDKPTHYPELLAQVRARRKLPPAPERRRIREQAGLSLRAVAAALSVSHQTVSYWERGATPRASLCDAYARLLDEVREALDEAAA